MPDTGADRGADRGAEHGAGGGADPGVAASPDPGEGYDWRGDVAGRVVTHECPRCGRPRLFRVVAREGRLRMICPQCDLDLPAQLGTRPATHWRDLVDGPLADPPEG